MLGNHKCIYKEQYKKPMYYCFVILYSQDKFSRENFIYRSRMCYISKNVDQQNDVLRTNALEESTRSSDDDETTSEDAYGELE